MISPADARREIEALEKAEPEEDEADFTPLKDEFGAEEEADEDEWLVAAIALLDNVNDLFAIIPTVGFKNLVGMDTVKEYVKLKRDLQNYINQWDMRGVGE